MTSPWQNPLPTGEQIKNQVFVYCYSDEWIPIMTYCLEEAIALYRRSQKFGAEVLIFPLNANPYDFCSSVLN